MKPAKYHPLAESEQVGSAVFYEERRPLLGDAFLDSIEETLAKIRNAPEMGKPGKLGARSWKVRRFPYRIFYRIYPDRTWILAVAHLSRKPDYWLHRLD